MEAIKHGQPKEFKYGDMVVAIKSVASSADRLEVALSGGGAESYKVACRCMILGWRGFTRDGKDIPFSPLEFANIPDLPEGNFFILLGNFIAKETDILEANAKIKND